MSCFDCWHMTSHLMVNCNHLWQIEMHMFISFQALRKQLMLGRFSSFPTNNSFHKVVHKDLPWWCSACGASLLLLMWGNDQRCSWNSKMCINRKKNNVDLPRTFGFRDFFDKWCQRFPDCASHNHSNVGSPERLPRLTQEIAPLCVVHWWAHFFNQFLIVSWLQLID